MDAEAQGPAGLSPAARQLKERLLGEFSLSVDDVAGILEVDRSTVYRYIQDGALAALKIGREYRLSEADVEGFLQALIAGERERVAGLRLRALTAGGRSDAPEPVQVTEPGPSGQREFGPMALGAQTVAAGEARRTGHGVVHAAHLLLALLSDGDCVLWDRPFPEEVPMRRAMARQALARVGADLAALRRRGEDALPPPAPGPERSGRALDLAADLQSVLGENARTARSSLGRGWVGTDCLLLALYTRPELAHALEVSGAKEEAVRAEVQRMASALSSRHTQEPAYSLLALDAARRASILARGRGARLVEPADLLLALTADQDPMGDGLARRALEAVGADVPAIRAAAQARLGPAGQPLSGQDPEPTPEVRMVACERAPAAAQGLGHREVGTEHLLLGLYSLPGIADLLEEAGASHSAVRVCVRRLAPTGTSQPSEGVAGFARYSERAQRVIAQAQREARSRGAGEVSAAHLLLALLSEEPETKDSLARKAVEGLGVDVPALRAQVEGALPAGDHPASGQTGELPFSTEARALVMEHAPAAVRAMGHRSVGSEHLLLAVYDTSELLGRLVEGAGAPREGLEAAILHLSGGGEPVPALPLEGAAEQALVLAEQHARQRGHAAVQPGHLLLGLVDVGDDAGQILQRLEVDTAGLRVALEAHLPKRGRVAKATPVEMNAETKTVLVSHAVAAARATGSERVGTRHLLLGLYRVPALGALLATAGAPEDAVRVEALRLGSA